jgi:hypothetical protein
MTHNSQPNPAPRGTCIARQQLAQWSAVRVTGLLTGDAHLALTVARPPGALLILDFAPPHGLPYHARLDLGAEVADHMAAEAALPYLRTGALVSVAGDALVLRSAKGRSALHLVRARALVIPDTDSAGGATPAPEGMNHAH